MSRSYVVQITTFMIVSIAFLAMTVIHVIASSAVVPKVTFVNWFIRELFPLTYSISLLILVISLLHCIFRQSLKVLVPWLFTIFALVPVLRIFDNFAVECDVSKEIRKQIHAQLSTHELTSLSTPEGACPTFFSYKRESDGEWAVVTGASDYIHGTKVWFGTQ